MKRLWFLIFVLVGALLVWGGLVLRNSNAVLVVASPDKSLTLVARANTSPADPTKYGCIAFDVLDKNGQLVDHHQTGASRYMRWSIFWWGKSTIRLDSSDVGTYYWARGSDGKWHVQSDKVNW